MYKKLYPALKIYFLPLEGRPVSVCCTDAILASYAPFCWMLKC